VQALQTARKFPTRCCDSRFPDAEAPRQRRSVATSGCHLAASTKFDHLQRCLPEEYVHKLPAVPIRVVERPVPTAKLLKLISKTVGGEIEAAVVAARSRRLDLGRNDFCNESRLSDVGRDSVCLCFIPLS
jgi:hypothetical protein